MSTYFRLTATLLLAALPSLASALGERDIAALISLRPSVLKVEASDARGNVGVPGAKGDDALGPDVHLAMQTTEKSKLLKLKGSSMRP